MSRSKTHHATRRLLAGIGLTLSLAMMSAPSSAQVSKSGLTAIKAPSPPVLDGKIDEIWSQAPELSIPLAGGLITAEHTLTVRAMYDAEHVYFLYRWNDPTESLHRKPWEKMADGTWKQLKTVANDEQKWYEDKLAVFWAINAPTFAENGCTASCHMGTGAGRVGVMKAPKGELLDVWHWKATRTNPVGQVDDMYLDDTEWSEKTPEAGRKADPRIGGGYNDNYNADKTGPGFGPADGKAAPNFLMKSNVAPFQDTYKAGDRLAGIIIEKIEGDRGDVLAGAVHDGRGWTLEVKRRLTTGSKFDVQFDDLAKPYLFSPAVFDSVQVRHAISAEVYRMTFAK
jgi:Ethylbenzene dehydrogenase/Carbohydrate family 9 binding domain-like